MSRARKLFTKDFWLDSTERALKTAGQFAAFAWGTSAMTNVGEVVNVGTYTAFAAFSGLVMSYLTSLASAPIGDDGTPSIVSGGK